MIAAKIAASGYTEFPLIAHSVEKLASGGNSSILGLQCFNRSGSCPHPVLSSRTSPTGASSRAGRFQPRVRGSGGPGEGPGRQEKTD